ncbi:hypothetical protein BH20GEM1_BH20GEM1_16120 [soil metagenome]
MSAKSARTAPPAAVDVFAEALADWLSSFTVPQELAAEMASACSAGAPWAAAIAGTSVRRVGWPEPEALAWGIAIGASAVALEAARRSLDDGRIGAMTADGPALPLLAADGLIAAAHEALAALDAEHLAAGLDALGDTFGDGGPWKHLDARWPRPAWPTVVACGLGPAAAEDPDGPWDDLANAWRTAFADTGDAAPVPVGLGNHPAADRDTNELFAHASRAASGGDPGEGDDGERF